MDVNKQVTDLSNLLFKEADCALSGEDCDIIACLLVSNGYIKHQSGKWIERVYKPSWMEDDVEVFYECSVCGTNDGGEPPYCPNCGSRMSGSTAGSE
jgi:hypothetical protein